MSRSTNSGVPLWLKLLLGVLAIGLLAIASTQDLQSYLQTVLLWVQSLGVLAPIAFVLLYSIATVLLIPASVLTLGSGALFGIVLGSGVVFLGATIGATLAFLIGRYGVRDWVFQTIEGNEKFRTIDTAVAQEGLKIVFLTRLSPLFPFTLLNYAFSITQVSLRDYSLGSLGILPGTILYVYIGSLAGNLVAIGSTRAAPVQTIQWAVRIVGLLATIAVTVYVTHIARKSLDQHI